MKYIIPMIVGSIIGYLTNWLAIRMLFRPHSEKRILGFKIPFTPGMIPKERGRIAKSVGDTVEDYLLRPEKILEILLSEDSQVYFTTSLESKLGDLKEKNLKLSEVIDKLALDKDKIKNEISSLSITTITSYFEDETRKLEIISGLEAIYNSLEAELTKLLEDNKNQINIKLEEILVGYVDKYMQSIDGNLSLREFLDEDLVLDLDKLIDKNKSTIIKKTRQILLSDSIQLDLLESVRDLVEENVSRLITTFVPIEVIVAKIVETINKYISSEDYEGFIIEALDLAKNEVLDCKFKKNLNSKSSFLDSTKLRDRFLSRIDLVDHLEESIFDLSKAYKSEIIASSYRRLRSLKKDADLLETLERLIASLLDLLGDMEINTYLNKVQEEDIIRLLDKLKTLIAEIDPETMLALIDRLKISKIVEDEINSFEIDFAEELILDIAKRELQAITNLGALLGAILGLLSPLIQYL